MQYHFSDLIRKELVIVHPDVKDHETAIRRLVDLMVRQGFADPRFADDAIARERIFPTGLPTLPVATAMPHADPDHLNSSSVAVAVLADPVSFGQMGTDGSVTVEARIVFLLGIKERDKQVTMIGELMALLQNASLLDSLSRAQTPDEAFELLTSRVPS